MLGCIPIDEDEDDDEEEESPVRRLMLESELLEGEDRVISRVELDED
jgi:hypothetical protein